MKNLFSKVMSSIKPKQIPQQIPEKVAYLGSVNHGWNEIPIGVGINGEVVWDLKKAPHILVTGSAGSGKSVFQRNIILHCIQHPDKIKLYGFDLLRVELAPYKKYDNITIAVELEESIELLRSAREQITQRYAEMQECNVTNFEALKGEVPAIIVMVDEAYQLLTLEGSKIPESIEHDRLKCEASAILGDIARLGRAAGVHLVLATQRPDANIIHGELKSNLTGRIVVGRTGVQASMMTLDNEQATLLPSIKGRGYYKVGDQGEEFQIYYTSFMGREWLDQWDSDNSKN